jgi:hypothetical protein
MLDGEKTYLNLLVVASVQTWTERLVSTRNIRNGCRRETTDGRLRSSGEVLAQSTEVRDQTHHDVVKHTKSARSRHTPKLYADVEWINHTTGNSQKRPGKKAHRAVSSPVPAKCNLKRKTAMSTELEENPYQRARLSYRRQEYHLASSNGTVPTELPVQPILSVLPAVGQHPAPDGETLDQPGPHVEFEPAVTHTGSIADRVLDGEPATTMAPVASQEPVVDNLRHRACAELRAQGITLPSSIDVILLPSAEMVMLLASVAPLPYATLSAAAPSACCAESSQLAAENHVSCDGSEVSGSDAGRSAGQENGRPLTVLTSVCTCLRRQRACCLCRRSTAGAVRWRAPQTCKCKTLLRCRTHPYSRCVHGHAAQGRGACTQRQKTRRGTGPDRVCNPSTIQTLERSAA